MSRIRLNMSTVCADGLKKLKNLSKILRKHFVEVIFLKRVGANKIVDIGNLANENAP